MNAVTSDHFPSADERCLGPPYSFKWPATASSIRTSKMMITAVPTRTLLSKPFDCQNGRVGFTRSASNIRFPRSRPSGSLTAERDCVTAAADAGAAR